MTAGRWLITGASGFLGRHVLTNLLQQPTRPDLLTLVRDPHEWERMEWTGELRGVETITGSVTQPRPWENDPRLAGLTGVLHLAALVSHSRQHPEEMDRTNVTGTANMVRLAARAGARIVFVSTSGTVGCFRAPEDAADEESPYCETTVSGWPYYVSKIRAEREATRLADQLGVELVIVRPPVLLGPGDHRYRSTGHLIRFLRGRLPFLVRGGVHYADVRDAAAALVAAMSIATPRPTYHLPGTSCTVAKFFADAASVARRDPPRWVLPFRPAWWLARLSSPLHLLPDPVVIEMAAHFWGMTSRFSGPDLGYTSRPGSETIRETIEWLQGHHPRLRR